MVQAAVMVTGAFRAQLLYSGLLQSAVQDGAKVDNRPRPLHHLPVDKKGWSSSYTEVFALLHRGSDHIFLLCFDTGLKLQRAEVVLFPLEACKAIKNTDSIFV